MSMVQMVMMHELAHNVHMNHRKEFWQARNVFAEEMKALWAKGFTGEGFWGSGRTTESLERIRGNSALAEQELADLQVCGGTFRSRRRKRKRAAVGPEVEELSWKAKRERRIEKKFGKNGQALGEDEHTRIMLEVGKKGAIGGKPRVAGSKRGRELRAAAAAARFPGQQQHKELEDGNSDGIGSLEEYEEDNIDGGEDAEDSNGQKILDSLGFSMVRVCEKEDGDDVHVQNEMDELGALENGVQSGGCQPGSRPADRNHYSQDDPVDAVSNPSTVLSTSPKRPRLGGRTRSTAQQSSSSVTPRNETSTSEQLRNSHPPISPASTIPHRASSAASDKVTGHTAISPSGPTLTSLNCPICTTVNDPLSPTCLICAHVLDTRKDARCWQCRSQACVRSKYLNAGDCGVCGICGTRRDGKMTGPP